MGLQSMGWGWSRRGHREEAGGTKGPCPGQPAGKRQQHGQESISRGCAGVDAWGSPQGSPADTARARAGFMPQMCPLSPPTHTPKAKPAKAQAVSRVTRRAKPCRARREPDFTRETQRGPFQPELLPLSTKQRVMPKDLWGQGWAGSLMASSLSSRGP